MFTGPSEYRALDVTGPMADRVVAFSRGGVAATVVPRLAMGIVGGDSATWAVADGPAAETVVTCPRSLGGRDLGHVHGATVALPELWSVLPAWPHPGLAVTTLRGVGPEAEAVGEVHDG